MRAEALLQGWDMHPSSARYGKDTALIATGSSNRQAGKAGRLEEEIRIQQAVIRQIGPTELTSMPAAEARLERLQSLLSALRRSQS